MLEFGVHSCHFMDVPKLKHDQEAILYTEGEQKRPITCFPNSSPQASETDPNRAMKSPRTISLPTFLTNNLLQLEIETLFVLVCLGHCWGIHTDHHQVMVDFERNSHWHYSVIDTSRKRHEAFHQSVFDSKTKSWITTLAFLLPDQKKVYPLPNPVSCLTPEK